MDFHVTKFKKVEKIIAKKTIFALKMVFIHEAFHVNPPTAKFLARV